MEKDIRKFRQEVRANENDAERRREICDDFSYIPENNDAATCARCRKNLLPGERYWLFQGDEGPVCDGCFCDLLEAQVRRERGLDFETYEGGGTILVGVEGEDFIFRA